MKLNQVQAFVPFSLSYVNRFRATVLSALTGKRFCIFLTELFSCTAWRWQTCREVTWNHNACQAPPAPAANARSCTASGFPEISSFLVLVDMVSLFCVFAAKVLTCMCPSGRNYAATEGCCKLQRDPDATGLRMQILDKVKLSCARCGNFCCKHPASESYHSSPECAVPCR